MGYTTDFEGRFRLNKRLKKSHEKKLKDFAGGYHSKENGGCPGGYCQWVPTDDGEAIVWDGNEKFYDYIDWIEYLVKEFIDPWGYVLNGEVEWTGEDPRDIGKIEIKDNKVTVYDGKVVYEERGNG